jgi:hypothetical protein
MCPLRYMSFGINVQMIPVSLCPGVLRLCIFASVYPFLLERRVVCLVHALPWVS